MSSEAKPEKQEGKGKRKLLLAVPLLLAAAGAGLWFSGILPKLLQGGAEDAHAEHAAPPPRAPVFFDMPDIVANLSVSGRRASYIKLRSKLELARAEDAAPLQAAMPRLLDLFTTYLRELRPEELRGSSGTQRLREELIARANLAAPPARVTDILFTELLLQ
ncbi:flagellar basal body-associated FliL family protein [Belnapia sp. F-4-1]|uniref:flagellar basal body-associated FliL family protein n=1 Tax=Belnapia sp. F-4-1 TaxID=1545443 RepID=UPI0005B9CAD8|nr:flagellar basal body-associated FliL family protein [Belnapia sp. F-4-1]